MSTNALVSVVIPVYNGSAYLEQAIRSVLAQTYPHIEIIAVNDGSTDESAQILARVGTQVRVISQANAGVAAARNAGIANARGEFICFLDQDDYWRPEKVAEQVARFRSSDRVGLVHTDVICHNEHNNNFTNHINPADPKQMVGDCYERLLMGNAICNSSVMVRKSLIDIVGLCDPRIRGNTVQDYDLWLRVASVSHLDCVPKRLTVFRLHGGQGHSDHRAMIREELELLLPLRPERRMACPTRWPSPVGPAL